MLYQLTATTVQMCLPVPVPAAAPGGWLDLLDHWQTLIGATAGGLLGVAGAWIVAVSAHRRERRVAAGMILPDLMQLVAADGSLEKLADQDQEPVPVAADLEPVTRAWFVVGKLSEWRPNLFALHTPTIGQLSDIDARLYSHVFQCQMIHRAFEVHMDARQVFQDAQFEAGIGNPPRVRRPSRTDLQLYADWRLCVEHATLANYFLDRLVFSRLPRWCHRVRMKYFPNDLDERSAALRETGTLLPAAPSANAVPAAPAGT